MILEKTVLPAPKDMKIVSKYALVLRSRQEYAVEFCKEHGRQELIKKDDFYPDLGHWYMIGLHPRFSILRAFLKKHQLRQEISFLMGYWGSNDNRNEEARKKSFFDALRKSKTPDDFLREMYPHLFITIKPDDRDFRVTCAFRDKMKAKSFTIEDFFVETNQELRRLMLRSGLSIKDVLGRLKLVAEDAEGKIYEMPRPPVTNGGGLRNPLFAGTPPRYLYVVCPSTGQEYLLGVPGQFDVPKDARRWTFAVPPDAEFVKEA